MTSSPTRTATLLRILHAVKAHKLPFVVRFQQRPQHFVHILQPGKHRLIAFPYEVLKTTKTPRICCSNWSVLGSDRPTLSFGQPHKKKSHAARPGFRRGHSIGPLRPIHRPGKCLETVIGKSKKKKSQGYNSWTEGYSYTDTIWSSWTATSWPLQFSRINVFTSDTL